jgi:type III secretion system FlhB-like substrate exporter
VSGHKDSRWQVELCQNAECLCHPSFHTVDSEIRKQLYEALRELYFFLNIGNKVDVHFMLLYSLPN